ncbi:MAG: AAA family ATPase [Rhodobacteraceae bacterium]|nr:AAA family ATPase [Paracoccaceae bacterium]
MTVIAISKPKVGSGKTTLATNLASALFDRVLGVLLVDTDPQGSVRDWHEVTANNPLLLVGLDRPNNLKTIDSMERHPKRTFIIIHKICGTRLDSDVREDFDEYDLPVLVAETIPVDLSVAECSRNDRF